MRKRLVITLPSKIFFAGRVTRDGHFDDVDDLITETW